MEQGRSCSPAAPPLRTRRPSRQATSTATARSTSRSLPGVGIFAGPGLSRTSPCLFAGDDPIAVQAADFDGDGRIDLAVVSGTAQGLRIFKGQGDGTFVQVMTAQA